MIKIFDLAQARKKASSKAVRIEPPKDQPKPKPKKKAKLAKKAKKICQEQKEMLALPQSSENSSVNVNLNLNANVNTIVNANANEFPEEPVYNNNNDQGSYSGNHTMRQMPAVGMMRPSPPSQHQGWNNTQNNGPNQQFFHTRFPALPSSHHGPLFSPHHNNRPSFHIPFSGGLFKGGRLGQLGIGLGGGNGVPLAPRALPMPPSSADYFGQFHHLMRRGQEAPLPMPPPMVPHQYYNYMMHSHLSQGGCQSPQSDIQNMQQGMDMGPSDAQIRSYGTPNTPLSPVLLVENRKLSGGKNGGPSDGPRADAWTSGPKDSDKSNTVGYRILKGATTTHVICSVCCKQDARLCTACGHVAYCSVSCQRIDWPRHKRTECMPPVALDKKIILSKLCGKQLMIEENCGACVENGAGDGPDSERTVLAEQSHEMENTQDTEYSGKFLARRFIQQGESIHIAKPIMMASNDKGLPHPPDSILCLECCRWYQSSTGYRCSKCHWPVCGVECENGPLHSKYECPVFVAHSVPPPPNNDHTQFYDDTVLALRVILMKLHEPEKFEELYEWKDLENSMQKTSQWMDYDSRIRTFLVETCNILEIVDGLTYENIQTILLLVDASSVIMDDRVAFRETENEKTFHCAKYVIPNKLLIAEECSPNCKWSIHHGTKLDDCALRNHAATDIQPGGYITICFSSIWKHGSTYINRYDDFRFDFVCSCRRCRDPSEFGTFFSGIKCKQCDNKLSDGFLLPSDPSNPLSEWECQNTTCKSNCKGQAIIEEVNRLNNKMKLHQNDYWQLVGFVFENNAKVLHPNHFLLFKACWTCLELFWGSLKGLPFFSQRYEFFNSCTHIAKKALALLDVILPGASIQRGRILFLLSLAEAYRTLRDYRRYLEWGGEDAKKCISMPFWFIQKIQKEAFQVLITEPYGSMEHRMAIMLQDTIEDQIDLFCHTPIHVPLDHMVVYVLHKIYTRFTSTFYEPSIPLFEDEDISKFLVSTGPIASHMVTKKPVM